VFEFPSKNPSKILRGKKICLWHLSFCVSGSVVVLGPEHLLRWS
jgi:hypothetical protein